MPEDTIWVNPAFMNPTQVAVETGLVAVSEPSGEEEEVVFINVD